MLINTPFSVEAVVETLINQRLAASMILHLSEKDVCYQEYKEGVIVSYFITLVYEFMTLAMTFHTYTCTYHQ